MSTPQRASPLRFRFAVPAPHPQLREKLIAASEEMVAARGLAAFSLRQVAQQVGVSPSAIYRHFPDKEGMLTAVVEEGVGVILALQDALLAEAGPAPLDRLEAMGVAQVRFACRYPTRFRLLHTPEYSDPRQSPILAEAMARSDARIAGLITELEAAGLRDTEVLLRAALAMTYGLCRMYVEGLLPELDGPEALEAAARESYALLRRGLEGESAAQVGVG